MTTTPEQEEWDGALPIGDVIDRRPAVAGDRQDTADSDRADTVEDLLFDQMLENDK